MSMLGLEKLHTPNAGPSTAEKTVGRVPSHDVRPLAPPAAPVSSGGEILDRPTVQAMGERVQLLLGGRFEVLQAIATGGMATIFQLRHRLHHGLFVAKVLHPDLATRPGVLRSFRNESIHAARLGAHPNAVPIFDFGELDGLFFMLMPFIEGEDLDRMLQRSGPLTQAEALQLGAQISSLLRHAETMDIIHCDVTPGNIRLDTFGRYRLLDFGISRSPSEQDEHLAGGTPLYASPEQLLGKATDIRSDLYSLGVVLAEVLTGTPLFAGDSLANIKRRHLENDWTMPPVLKDDDPLAELLRSLLAVDPADRIGSASEASGLFEAMGQGRTEFRMSSSTDRPPQTPAARRRLSP